MDQWMDNQMSSRQEIADAAAFAWQPRTREPRQVLLCIVLSLAHASFPWLAVSLLVR